MPLISQAIDRASTNQLGQSGLIGSAAILTQSVPRQQKIVVTRCDRLKTRPDPLPSPADQLIEQEDWSNLKHMQLFLYTSIGVVVNKHWHVQRLTCTSNTNSSFSVWLIVGKLATNK